MNYTPEQIQIYKELAYMSFYGDLDNEVMVTINNNGDNTSHQNNETVTMTIKQCLDRHFIEKFEKIQQN